MRALIFTLIMVTTLIVAVDTQAESSFPFGVKGGINWATWDWGNEYDVEGNTTYSGWQLGAFVEWDFDWILSVELDLLYSMRGTKISQVRDEAKFNTAYFDVPLLLKYTFDLEYSRPYFVLGPSFNFLMSADYVAGSDTEDIQNDLEPMEFAMVVGFGIHMKSVLLEGRYNMAMTDVNKDGGITSSFWVANFGITF